MKRKASAAFQDAEDNAGEAPPPRLDDCFLAAEILTQLPAHTARAFSAASAFFRGVLTHPDFWLAGPHRARAPTIPHAACLVVRGAAGGLHEFHYGNAGFTAEAAGKSLAA